MSERRPHREPRERLRPPTAEEIAAALEEPDHSGRMSGPERRHWSDTQVVARLSVPELRHAESKRFDAAAIAARLGLSIEEVSVAAGTSVRLLALQTDAAEAQPGLEALVRIIVAAEELVGPEMVATWFRSPNRALGGASPSALVLAGKAEALARRLEGALGGVLD